MTPLQLSDIKKIQLDILRTVDSFCRERGLRYSLAYGSLIGAVRHGGFIPWDDDIDLLMPRADYDRLTDEFNDAAPAGLRLHCLASDNSYAAVYAKIEDTSTVLVEKSSTKPIGVNIDIFPIDPLFDSHIESARYVDAMKRLKLLYRSKIVRPTKKNSFAKKIGIIAAKMVSLPFTARSLALKIDRKMRGGQPGAKYSGYAGSTIGSRDIFESTLFENIRRIRFEDTEAMAIAGYDTYLRAIYGDYMQLPPEGERCSPHTIVEVYRK